MIGMDSSRKKSEFGSSITRRELGRQLGRACLGLTLASNQESAPAAKSSVIIVKGMDRAMAFASALNSLGTLSFKNKDVYLKGNFNSAHPFPASTHPDALFAAAGLLRERDCARVTLIERSGMGATSEIWEKQGILTLSKRLGIRLVPLEELGPSDWRLEELPGSHWKSGVHVPTFLTSETCVVQICNLKTHRFGGHFSGSLKNSIGLIARISPQNPRHNYMTELHSSTHQRRMIAEVNQVYAPAVVLMDATQIFIDGGPERGERAFPGVVAVSSDRVAIDAVGAALLRLFGAGHPLNKGDIFDLEQLKRGVELKLGAKSAEEVEIIPGNQEAQPLATQLKALLASIAK
jgi:uncharacterized protein (DUF362 family)